MRGTGGIEEDLLADRALVMMVAASTNTCALIYREALKD